MNHIKQIKSKLEKSAMVNNGVYYCVNNSDVNIVQSNTQAEENLIRDEYQSPVGLRIIDIKKNDIGVQFGCNPSSLLLYAKNVCSLMAVVDDSKKLHYLNDQIQKKNKKDNILLINNYLLNDGCLNNSFDFAIISSTKNINTPPFILKAAKKMLKSGGKLYFANDNKNYYRNYFSLRWPFVNVRSLLSKNEYIKLLDRAGFVDIQPYAVFPDRKTPQKIYPIDSVNQISYEAVGFQFRKPTLLNKLIRKIFIYIDLLIFKKLKCFDLSPSFIFLNKIN